MLFLVVYPDKLKHLLVVYGIDFGNTTQTTTFMVSGGATGGGTLDTMFVFVMEVKFMMFF